MTAGTAARVVPEAQPSSRVLVVDDDAHVRRALVRALGSAGLDVLEASDAATALRLLDREPDVVVSDIAMPGVSGLDLLHAIRKRDLELPVLFLTGAATPENVDDALRHGAFCVLRKPIGPHELISVVRDATQMRKLALVRDEAHALAAERSGLEQDFQRALDALYMVYQPVVSAETKATIGWEALMRSRDAKLSSPLAILDAAEKLSAIHVLGRTVRERVAADLAARGGDELVFVNLHASDLADPALYAGNALAPHAGRIVLELTERATLEGISDLADCVDRLRRLGFRLAVDDLGAGYSGMSSFARVRPEVVKIDMSLVRGIDGDEVKRHIVRSLIDLAHGLSMRVVTEGVETPGERDACVALGADYLQGYLLGRPAPELSRAVWG